MASTSSAVASAAQSPSYAGLDRRIAAHLVDVVIAFAVTLTAGLVMRALRAAGIWTPLENIDAIEVWREFTVPAKIAVIAAFIVSMGPVYSALFEASAWQATIGKRLFNIYVTDTAGRRISLGRSLGRSFGKRVFNFFYLVLVSIGMIAAAARHQGLHDYAAHTQVLRGRPSEAGPLELWRPLVAFVVQCLWFGITFFAVIPNTH